MMLAQKLNEGVELGPEGAVGLITYMRTDSTRVSEAALSDARDFIGTQYGQNYLPDKAVHYRSKKMRKTRTKRFVQRTSNTRRIPLASIPIKKSLNPNGWTCI